jgi:hypothetical protein
VTRILLALVGTLALASCRSAATSEGSRFYTRFGLRIDGRVCSSTNYRGERSSSLLPINSAVEYVSQRRGSFTLRIVGGPEFTFKHVEKHTLDEAKESFHKFFSTEPTDLSAFPPEEQEAIQKGEATVGMSRAAVLAAMGPPPAVGTLTLDGDVWKYWSSRFVTFHVRFGEDGRVVEIGR